MEKHGSKFLVWFWKRDSCPAQELTKQCRNTLLCGDQEDEQGTMHCLL